MRVLLTGGTGFFGSCLRRHFEKAGVDYLNFDLIEDPSDAAQGRFFRGDLSNASDVQACFQKHGSFDAVCHVAAQLAHDVRSKDFLWRSNVDGTRHLAEAARRNGVRRFIFTSTNCLWGRSLGRPVHEEDAPAPIEIYGQSKLAAEAELGLLSDDMDIAIFRSPTIMGAGRIGLLSLLFDFVLENRRIPVVGSGNKLYQFISADDYARAILASLATSLSGTFHIGSDRPCSLREAYEHLIRKSGSKSRCYHVPAGLAVPAMRVLHRVGLSPLGPYQSAMISEEFVFDITKIKKSLAWTPAHSNQDAFWDAFDYYRQNLALLEQHHADLPAHRRKAAPGIIRLLKWLS